MQIRPRISKKAKAKASLAYAEHILRFGVENPLKANWNAMLYKITGRSYDARTTAEQTRKRFKKDIKEKKHALAKADQENKALALKLDRAKKMLSRAGGYVPENQKLKQMENINALEKELAQQSKGVRELRQVMTAAELGSSDKETRKRFFRMKKFKRNGKKHQQP